MRRANFLSSFTFDHTVCVVDNDDNGLAFNRFTGKVLAHYDGRQPGQEAIPLLVDVEEYRRAYGEFPPNDTLSTALDFGYWFKWAFDEAGKPVRYDAAEPEYRREVLRDKLLQHFMPSVTDYAAFDGIRDIEFRPWRHDVVADEAGRAVRGAINECKPEDAEGWGLYGRTFQGPAWHLCDVASREQAYWLRAALAALIVTTPRLHDPYEAARLRMEALDGVKFDEGR